MGARGVPSCPLFLDNVFVPEANMLGGGFKAVMEAFQRQPSADRGARRRAGAGRAGPCHRVRDQPRGVRPAGQRLPGVRWMLADMAIQTEAARHLSHRAASLVDSGAPAAALAPVAAMAKCFASDTAMKVATDAVQLFGAAGISSEYPINRYFRDAKVLQIIEGTNQIQRNIISNSLLGRPNRK